MTKLEALKATIDAIRLHIRMRKQHIKRYMSKYECDSVASKYADARYYELTELEDFVECTITDSEEKGVLSLLTEIRAAEPALDNKNKVAKRNKSQGK